MTANPYLQQLLTLPSVLNARLSPDGRWVAFLWYRIHENVDVFLAPSDGSAAPVALTRTPEYTTLASWTADSQAVIVAEDHDSDEHARLFRVDITRPGEMQPLTEDHPPYFIRGGSLSPDGALLYYGANYDFSLGQVIEPTWIYRHDLGSGERTPIAKPDLPGYVIPELNLKGTHLIYARKDRHPNGRQYYLVDVDGQSDSEILNFGDQVKVFARWFPDGENILFLSEATGPNQAGAELTPGTRQDHNSVGIYHWPSGDLRWLVDDPTRNIEGAWVSPDGLVVIDEVVEAGHHPSVLEPSSGVETPLPPLPGNLLPIGRSAAGDWIALHYASTSPSEVVRFSPGADPSNVIISLTRVWEHTSLDPQRLVQAESFHFPSDDGLRIQGWLYRAHPNPRRAVIHVHGGPTYHSEDKLDPQIQYLVAAGFNVLSVNYRGSTGFSLGFTNSIKEDGWGGREQNDLAAAARTLIAAGLAAPGRVGVTGTSYGGYSSWFLITHYPPEVFAAAVPICGMTDLVVDYESTRPDLRPYSEEMLGGTPSQVPERYYERSPIHFVQNIRGKVLIVQGAQDPNVTPENVRQVREQLDAHAIPYELLVFQDEGHGISKPVNQEKLFTRMAAFFDAALGKPVF